MKRKSTNKFKEKINEIEFQPSQADWKSFSSALDKSMPFDSGITGSLGKTSASAATGALGSTIGSITWGSIFSKLFLALAVGAGIYSLSTTINSKKENSSNISINKNTVQTNNSQQTKNEILNLKSLKNNEPTTERFTTQQTENILKEETKKTTIYKDLTSNSSTQLGNQISKISSKKKHKKINLVKGSTEKSNLNTNKYSNQNNNTKLNSITKNDNSHASSNDLIERLKKGDNKRIHTPLNTKKSQEIIDSNKGMSVSNSEQIGLSLLPSIQFNRKDEGIENLLNEYISGILLSPEANLDLVFNFENIRLQAMFLGTDDYQGLGVTIMQPIRGNKFCSFFLGIGLSFVDYSNSTSLYDQTIFSLPNQTPGAKIYVQTETSVSIIGEAKKFLWKDRLSIYLTLKPELVVARSGNAALKNEVTSNINHYQLQIADQGYTKELMLSAGLGIDFRFSQKFEARIGYENGFIETIDASKTINNKVIKRGHVNIGLNYNFMQKIK